MQKYLPTNDLLFRKLFSSEDSQHILKAFIKDLIGIEFKTLTPTVTYHIDSYIKSYEENEQSELKRTEVDVLAIDENGAHATIECQIQSKQRKLKRRTIFQVCVQPMESIFWILICLMRMSKLCSCFVY